MRFEINEFIVHYKIKELIHKFTVHYITLKSRRYKTVMEM